MIWFDHDLHECCPVHHLLAWLKLSVIKDDYFFPDYYYLCSNIVSNPGWDGCCTEGISYCYVLVAWKNLCSTILERVGKLGAHSGRKTGCFLGVWGGAQDTGLMLRECQKTMKIP
jgi:hypothetical protein